MQNKHDHGNEPTACHHCGQEFGCTGLLYAHLESVHNEKVYNG